ncbi:MAG: biotin synthase BioB [Tepidisphaeraceae bacterium]
MAVEIRCDWTLEEIRGLAEVGLLELVFRAATVHRQFHRPGEIQVCKLISVKTGACPEDCAYCSQSSRYETEVRPTALMGREEVVELARRAKEGGASRVCLGAAWREVKDNAQFERVLEMVRDVSGLGLEVCCTLGMLNEDQARRLEEAGLYAYNHNIDSSERFYQTIITTRKFGDRLNTIEQIRKTKVTVCCGGIIGMGETTEDRLAMLHTLATMRPHPESVPINVLAKVPGTPMEDRPDLPIWETVRMIALARLLMPASVVRLSAGRAKLSVSDQALCFLAGANSIFSSDNGQMLTAAVPSPKYDADARLMELLGLRAMEPFQTERGHSRFSAAQSPQRKS